MVARSIDRCLRVRYAPPGGTPWTMAWRSLLDVLDVLGRAQLLEVLGVDDVAPADGLAPVADGVDEGLVHEILDAGAGGVRGDGGELVDLVGGELVADLGQVPLVGAQPALLGRVAHLVHAVDAPRPEQGLVEGRAVAGHHHQDAAFGRRLGVHAQQPAAEAVEDAPGLLQARQLRQQGLERAHAAPAHAGHDHPVTCAPGRGSTDDGAVEAASTAARDRGDSQRRCAIQSDHGELPASRAERAPTCPPSGPGAPEPRYQRVGLVEEHDHAGQRSDSLRSLRNSPSPSARQHP